MSPHASPPSTSQPLITRELLRELGDWKVSREGRHLAETGRVQTVTYEPPLLQGTVHSSGGSSVKARLKLGSQAFEAENLCSCKVAQETGLMCAHVVALVHVWIEISENHATGAMVPSASQEPRANNSPVLTPSPALRRVIDEGISVESSRRLELSVILPLDLESHWRNGTFRVIVEGTVDGKERLLLDAILKESQTLWRVREEDERLLTTLESMCEGRIQGMFILSPQHFDTLFTALEGHPRVLRGKKESLLVRGETLEEKTSVVFKLQLDGTATLSLAGTPPSVDSKKHPLALRFLNWTLRGNEIIRFTPLPAIYMTMLAAGPVTLSREEFANFHQREFAALQLQIPVETQGPFEKLEYMEIRTPAELLLDGGLRGLTLKLTSCVQGKEQAAGWKPDPGNSFRYVKRSGTPQVKLEDEFRRMGFQKQGSIHRMESEVKVGEFLAEVLPAWMKREDWKLQIGNQLQAVLDQCDAIEPEIKVSRQENWLGVDLEFKKTSSESQVLDEKEIRLMLQKGVSHQRMPDGRVALIKRSKVEELESFLSESNAERDGDQARIDSRYAPWLGRLMEESEIQLSSVSLWKPPADLTTHSDLALPPTLDHRLRPYQKTGVNWLNYLGLNGMGGILADEMGLGKTIQTLIYLAAKTARQAAPKPHLVICPTSLVTNWREESAKFTPELKVLTLRGPDRHADFAKIPEANLVITSYALLRRDVEQYASIHFDSLVLDEAQQIKNRASQNARSAKAIRADQRWVLTGTPMENSLLDLWSIFDFLMPGYLGNARNFKERFEDPIAKQNDPATLRRLRQRVGPFILRRTKAGVAPDLPERIEQITWCDLSAEQQEVYQAILETGRKEVFELSGKQDRQKGRDRIALLATLTRLRQAACHLALLPAQKQGARWMEPSGKLDVCMEKIIESVAGGHRLLVFSQFTSMLKLITEAIEEEGLKYCYLDGSTLDRDSEIRRFRESETIPLFLISLKAGGTGLNLPEADTVIHFDPWWNPAIEEQATARAHRIGQKNVVNSYKLISKGTVEEKIIQLQERKKNLISKTMTGEAAFIQNLTLEELQELLN